jgi:hypothetical protein
VVNCHETHPNHYWKAFLWQGQRGVLAVRSGNSHTPSRTRIIRIYNAPLARHWPKGGRESSQDNFGRPQEDQGPTDLAHFSSQGSLFADSLGIARGFSPPTPLPQTPLRGEAAWPVFPPSGYGACRRWGKQRTLGPSAPSFPSGIFLSLRRPHRGIASLSCNGRTRHGGRPGQRWGRLPIDPFRRRNRSGGP